MNKEEQEVIEKLKDNFILTTSEQNKLVNLIDRLLKENEELKEGLNFRINYCKKLEQELYGEDFEETLVEKKYFVSKDKIRNKMKEIEFYINNVDNNEGQAIYKVLEDLLKEK